MSRRRNELDKLINRLNSVDEYEYRYPEDIDHILKEIEALHPLEAAYVAINLNIHGLPKAIADEV